MKLPAIIKTPLIHGIAGLLLISSQVSFALPPAFQASFSVSKGSMTLGNLNAVLKYSGNRYSYHKYTKATGIAALLTGIRITENTDGRISSQHIIPENYYFNRSKRNKAKIDKIKFSQTSAIGNYKGKPYKLPITPNTHDRASLEIILAQDLSQNKKRLSYPVIERGKKLNYNFQRIGNEKLKTPAGTFNTIKVKVVRSGNKRETIFWMAKELDYMPVKIRHREKKDIITSVLNSFKKL